MARGKPCHQRHVLHCQPPCKPFPWKKFPWYL